MKIRKLAAGALLGVWLLLLLAGGFTVAMASANLRSRPAPAMRSVPAPVQRSGVIVNYVPGVTITIQSGLGRTTTFSLGSAVIVVPAARATEVGIGKNVTIIVPDSAPLSAPAAIGII